MKKIIIVLLALGSISSFAQDSYLEFLVKYQPGNLEYIADQNPIPERYKMNDIEKKQSKVLKCIRTIAQKNKKSQKHIDVLQSLMSELKQSSPDELGSINKLCKKHKRSLKNSKGNLSDSEVKALLDRQPESRKILSNFIFVQNKCVIKRVYAQAAALLGVKVGVGVLVCQRSDARKTKYFSPSVGITTNFGANIGYEKVFIDNKRVIFDENDDQNKTIGKALALTWDQSSNFALITGRSYVASTGIRIIDQSDLSVGRTLGLSSITGSSLNLGVRVFNGRENWKNILIDLNN
jgi:hypothetical protein